MLGRMWAPAFMGRILALSAGLLFLAGCGGAGHGAEPPALSAEPLDGEGEEAFGGELQKFIRANTFEEAIREAGSIGYHRTDLGPGGKPERSVTILASRDEAAYMDSSGAMEYIGADMWAGYSPEEKRVYKVADIGGDARERKLKSLQDECGLRFSGDAYTEEIKERGGVVTVTRRGTLGAGEAEALSAAWGGAASEGARFFDIYSFDDSRRFLEAKRYLAVDGGDLAIISITAREKDPEIAFDDGIAQAVGGGEQRKLLLHIDYGTDAAREEEWSTGIGTAFRLAMPEGYEKAYLDKECAVELAVQDLLGDIEAYIYKGR